MIDPGDNVCCGDPRLASFTNPYDAVQRIKELEHELTCSLQNIISLKKENEALKRASEFNEGEEKHFFRIPEGYEVFKIELIRKSPSFITVQEKGENL